MEGKQNNQTTDSATADLLSVAEKGSLNLPGIVLASTSPRRAEILRTVGWSFETFAVNVDETLAADEDAPDYVERLARAKAAAAVVHCPSRLVLGADTVVIVDDEILGKPRDEEDARQMLRRLSGRRHQVLTGVALINGQPSQSVVAHEITEVKFATLSDDEIGWYAATGEPMDKAGAYAIQGRGARFIEEIKGDYFNIVGLPVRLLYKLVQNI
jgi:nucleoside triphosphate pyrophosphatase